jgi:tRNA nucleotidyltransferase (CCA-adding enzyme)
VYKRQIRDLLDPDALFLFVRGKEGLRLVARSSTDEVDVSQAAIQFGGGGHPRAAAALIHADDEFLKNENPAGIAINNLVEFLQQNIKPSLTVARIMSKKPLLITKGTSIRDALKLMLRYGYEGYPVVEGSTVVGLLTRRSVDKAASHKLELTAGSLMDAGSVSLRPDQTLDEVQELMANTGWGQIPVIDPVSSAIIGIVTRTDLLKNLQRLQPKKNINGNYAEKIEKALSPGRLALIKKVIEKANDHNLPIYTVGGFVRDLVLDRPSHDLDIVIEGDAIKIANELAQSLGGRVVCHRRFGTAKWQINGTRKELASKLRITPEQAEDLPDFLDLISARTEFYEHPTAMPTVENSSIKLDLHRRDFTINTLAIRLDRKHYGELIDHWGGLEDLHKKKIRVLHSLSFVDDPTRMLRAVRFEQRFDFQIEERTLQLIEEARPMLRQVSGDRLRHEFDLVFREENPARIMKRLQELHLLHAIDENLIWEIDQSSAFVKLKTSQPDSYWSLPGEVGNVPVEIALHWLVWFGSLAPSCVSDLSRRFKFPSQLTAALKSTSDILEGLNSLHDTKPSIVSTMLDGVPPVSLYAAYLLTSKNESKELVCTYVKKWKNVRISVSGNDLRQAGILPGPEYKRILTSLRSAYLDGVITSPKEERDLLQQLIKQD